MSYNLPDDKGHFDQYGGIFVAETLMTAVTELKIAYEKFKDHQMHSSPYIDSRIGEFLIRDFNDETRQRIILEEIESGATDEKGFNSDFINNRIKEMSFDDLDEEMKIRQRLSDCESHTTP